MRISLIIPIAIVSALILAGCDNKKTAQSSSPAPPAIAAKPSLVDEAKRLGFAALVPQDAVFYLGTAQLKAHRATLEKTRFWKDLEAFANDKAPAADGKKAEAKTSLLSAMNVDDMFIAIGKDGTNKLGWLHELNAAYSEYTYLTMMTGYASAGAKGKGFNAEAMLSSAANFPDLLDRLCKALSKVEVPPVMLGVETDKPDEWLKQIIDPTAPPAWLANATKTTVSVPNGSGVAYEATFGELITQKRLDEWNAGITKAIADPAAQTKIKTALSQLAAKRIALVFATFDDIAIIAVGTDRQLQFATSPQQSLLARKDFEFAQAYAGKNFAGVIFAEGKLVDVVHDDQPFTPMLRGAVKGLTGNPMFGDLAKTLQPKVEEIAAAERKVHAFTAANAAGIMWWEDGIHIEMAGGYAPQGEALTKPRKLTSLMNTPNALLAVDGHSASVGAGRFYFEKWIELIYTASGELVKKGLGGEQAGVMYPMIDKLVVPSLRQIYDASKVVYQQALGTESALIIDVGGEMPQLPGVPAAGQKLPLPRIASVHEVTDRALISKSWEQMDLALKQAAQVSPIPMAAPAPISSKSDDMVSWFYPLPLGGNDLLPCVSLNDRVYVLGSSKSLNEALAVQLKQPPSADVPPTGTVYRLSFKTLRSILKSVGTTAIPGVKVENPGNAVLPWLAPFEDFNGRLWQEGTRARVSAEWKIHDVVKYD